MFATVHNTHFSQFMSMIPEPQALAIDALSQDWQGRSKYMFPPFRLLNKSFGNYVPPRGRGNSNSSWWPSQPQFSHTYFYCVWTTLLSIPLRYTVTRGIHLGWKVLPSARMEALMQHYQAAGFSEEVCRLAAAPRRPSTNHM